MENLQKQLWRGFKWASIGHLSLCLFLVLIDVVFVPDSSFAIYVVLGFGIILIIHGLVVRFTPELMRRFANISANAETGMSASFTTQKMIMSDYGVASYRGRYIEKGLLSFDGDFCLWNTGNSTIFSF